MSELDSHRPLIGRGCEFSDDAREVVATLDVIAQQPKEAFGGYVISMARQPSDVLALQLLLKETGCDYSLPVVPLFETLDDLNLPFCLKPILIDHFFRNGVSIIPDDELPIKNLHPFIRLI